MAAKKCYWGTEQVSGNGKEGPEMNDTVEKDNSAI